jgi:hypothetical protein
MRKVAVIIAGLLALQACDITGPSGPTRWSKPGGTHDDYTRDRYTCIRDARSTQSGGSQVVIRNSIFQPCMEARGWIKDPNGFAPPPGGEVQME